MKRLTNTHTGNLSMGKKNIVTIESYINKGNSCPVITNDKGRKYFVKLRAGMSGKYAMISEWLGNKLGSQLGIRTQTPMWFELNDEVETQDIYIEVKELVIKSWGINIGFDFKENAREIKRDELSGIDKKALAEIFLFDLMMINIDRTSSNVNLMSAGGEVFSVDYESSLLVQEMIEPRNLLGHSRILQCLRSNPIYHEIDEAFVDGFISKAKGVSVNEILSEIPASLLEEPNRQLLARGIEERKRNNWFIKDVLSKLKNITPETEMERKAARRKNQADFKRKLREN